LAILGPRLCHMSMVGSAGMMIFKSFVILVGVPRGGGRTSGHQDIARSGDRKKPNPPPRAAVPHVHGAIAAVHANWDHLGCSGMGSGRAVITVIAEIGMSSPRRNDGCSGIDWPETETPCAEQRDWDWL
jgi:hypothetical protein